VKNESEEDPKPAAKNSTQSLASQGSQPDTTIGTEGNEDKNERPYVQFDHANENIFFRQNNGLKLDLAQVQIKKQKDGKGALCELDQWAVVNYKGWDQDDNLVADSKADDSGKPFTFRIGYYEVNKCLDIAIQQMQPGEIADVTCPGSTAGGGQHDNYIMQTSAWLPTYSDVHYNIELMECSRKPNIFKEGWWGLDGHKLEDGRVFRFIASHKKSATGQNMAITVRDEDAYAPKYTTNIHNIYIAPEDPNDPRQEFYYNKQLQSIMSVSRGGQAWMEGGNKNLVTYNHIFKSHQEFDYNPKDEHIFSLFSGMAVDIQQDDIDKEHNIYVSDYIEDDDWQKWAVQYENRWESVI